MVVFERVMFSAMRRRTRVSCTTWSPSSGAEAGWGARVAGAALAWAANSCTSFLVTRPPMPLPVTCERSTLSSEPSISTAGEKRCSPDSSSGDGVDASGAAGAGGDVTGPTGAAGSGAKVLGRAGAAAGDGAAPATSPSAPSSTTAISAPACTVWPSLARISRRMPVTGAGTSALTLSVSTSSMGSNSTTLSPGLTSHFEMVPSWTDSPSCGITTRVILGILMASSGPSPLAGRGKGLGTWRSQSGSSVGRQLSQRLGDLLGVGHEEVLHRGCVRYGGNVQAAESLHRRVQPAPRLVGDQRRHLGTDGDAEVVLVQHQAPARLAG